VYLGSTMKFLVVSNCPLEESQGSGYVVLNFCRRLEARGHDVDVIGPDQLDVSKFLHRGRWLRYSVGMLISVIIALSKKRYDIVEFYGGESWLSASVLSRLPGRSCLLVHHSNGLETHYISRMCEGAGPRIEVGWQPQWYQALYKRLVKIAFTDVDGIVTVSEFDREFALQNGYQENHHIASIENGLPDSYLDLKIDLNRQPVIGFCGSWTLRKGIGILETVIPQILNDFSDARFKMIGVSQASLSGLKLTSEQKSRLEVIPFQDDKQALKSLYQSLSILVMPSYYESFGMVATEAMSCGCALIATDTGFVHGLTSGKEALIIEPQARALYSGIKTLLSDDKLRKEIALQGYKRVQSLEWNQSINRLEATYTNWLKERQLSI
jgi:glycosyltransferase involved in cell wall biosynthesis